MKRFFWVLLWIPVTMYALFLVAYTMFLNNMAESADDMYLNLLANYCSDAATVELLDTADIGTDYTSEGIVVDPELAVDEYGTMLALAQGYQPTQEVIDTVLRDNVKVLYVCAYDGYYVYQNELVGDGEYALIGTFKLPYTYEDDNGNLYALTLGGNKCWKFTSDGTGTTLLREQSSGLSPDLANSVINKRISDDMNKRITDIYVQDGNGWSNRVYIPASLSNFTSVNPVTSPTVLAFVDGISNGTAFGIGGTKLTEARKVAGYELEGIKYYCYVDLLPAGIREGNVIEAMFDSTDDAARAGYHCDVRYMK